jgi:hypothetical protein
MLLAHWQYFKRCDLMNFDWNDIEESALAFLEPSQIQCIKSVVRRLKEVCKFDLRFPQEPTVC